MPSRRCWSTPRWTSGRWCILTASLSFLGLGAPPPSPEWGAMITEGATNFYQWWIAAGPGMAILTVVLAVNFLGDGLRDHFDVRTRADERRRRATATDDRAAPAVISGLRVAFATAAARSRRCAASTSTSAAARPSPWSASPGPASPRCWPCSGCWPRNGAVDGRRGQLRRHGAARRAGESAMNAVRGPPDRHDLPGPDDTSTRWSTVGDQLGRGRPDPRRGHAGARPAARAVELLELVAIPDAGAPLRAVPARALRRHAPAGDDRHGARLPARSC